MSTHVDTPLLNPVVVFGTKEEVERPRNNKTGRAKWSDSAQPWGAECRDSRKRLTHTLRSACALFKQRRAPHAPLTCSPQTQRAPSLAGMALLGASKMLKSHTGRANARAVSRSSTSNPRPRASTPPALCSCRHSLASHGRVQAHDALPLLDVTAAPSPCHVCMCQGYHVPEPVNPRGCPPPCACGTRPYGLDGVRCVVHAGCRS